MTWSADAPATTSPQATVAPAAGTGADAGSQRATGQWASQLVAAFRAGRIRAAVMWDVLLTHLDANSQPDVGSLLEHLPELHASTLISLDDLLMRLELQATTENVDPAPAQEPCTLHESDDWFVMVDGHDAA